MIRRTTNAAASCSGRFFIDRYRRRRRHRYDHRYHRSRCAEIREIMENNSDYIGAHPVNTSGRVCPRARESELICSKKSYCLCPGCFIAVVRTRQHNTPRPRGRELLASTFSPIKYKTSHNYAKHLKRAEIIY